MRIADKKNDPSEYYLSLTFAASLEKEKKMIIHVRCFTCQSLVAEKWNLYQMLVEAYSKKQERGSSLKESIRKRRETINIETVHQFLKDDDQTHKQSPSYLAFEALGIRDICCRRIFLSTKTLIDEL